MENENPDIIIGYNIFGFDYEFMFRRSQENCKITEFMKLSRRNGSWPRWYSIKKHSKKQKIEKIQKLFWPVVNMI